LVISRILSHATLARHVPSLLRHGLLCAKSRGRKRVVWVADPGQAAWACLHVLRRHGGTPRDVVVLTVRVPGDELRRHGAPGRGLFYTARHVPPEQIRYITTYGEVTKSPVEEP
jgi:hypothetical protein